MTCIISKLQDYLIIQDYLITYKLLRLRPYLCVGVSPRQGKVFGIQLSCASCGSILNSGLTSKLAQRMVAGAYSLDSQSESEDDDYLAAAVAAADAKQGKTRKVKHPHLRALRGLGSKLGSISRGKDRDGSGSTTAASPTSEQVCLQKQKRTCLGMI